MYSLKRNSSSRWISYHLCTDTRKGNGIYNVGFRIVYVQTRGNKYFLFTYGDLLRLVETTQLELMKQVSFGDNGSSTIASGTLDPAFYTEAKKKISPERLSRDNAGVQQPSSLEGSLRGGNSFRKPRGGMPTMPTTINRKIEEMKREGSFDKMASGEREREMVRSASSGSLLAHSD